MSTLTEVIRNWISSQKTAIKKAEIKFDEESKSDSTKMFLFDLLEQYYEGTDEKKESLTETLYKLSNINSSYSLGKIDDHFLIDTLREYIVERDMK